MKKYTYFYIALLITQLSISQTTLALGELAIIGFNSSDPDEISFSILTDITAGTEIKFTDRGWRNNGSFRNGGRSEEGTLTWTATTNVPCGTQINIIEDGSGVFSATLGSVSETDNFDLILGGFSSGAGGRGEQILAYQGPDNNPSFLFGLDYSGNPFTSTSNATSNDTSSLPSPLSFGTGNSAVNHRPVAFGRTRCTTNPTDEINQVEVLEQATSGEGVGWTIGDGRQTPLGDCNIVCSLCPQTTTWNGGNWSDGVPNENIGAIIDNTYTASIHGSFTACDLTINNNDFLTVSNSRFVRVINDVINNGTLTVETQGNLVQVEDGSNFEDNGTSQVQKLTAFKPEWFHYTFWGSPVTNIPFGEALTNRPANRQFDFNASNYLDVVINEIGNPGVSTTPGHDGIDDNNDAYQIVRDTDIMLPGKGYAATENPNGFLPGQYQGLFEGTFNNGVITTPIAFNSDNTQILNGGEGAHFNFIANPYASAIDFSLFHSENSAIIEGIAYLWSQSNPPLETNIGNQSQNFSQNDYAIINVTGGIAGPSGSIPNDYIPSAQGFFVRSIAAGNVTFNNSMRVASEDSNLEFFGVENQNDILLNSNQNANTTTIEDHKIWITLTTDNGVFNQAMVGYVNNATNAYDGASFDAPRISPGGTTALFYSLIEGNDTPFAIQGKNLSSLTEEEIIVFGFETNIDVETTYTLSLTQFEGLFFENSTVFLQDNLLNTTHNLSDSDYSFTSEVGTFNDRFEIHFISQTLSSEDDFTPLKDNELIVFETKEGDLQFIISNNLDMESIQIIDLTGRIVYNLNAQGSENTYALNLKSAIYIAQIQLTNGNIISKKLLKQN